MNMRYLFNLLMILSLTMTTMAVTIGCEPQKEEVLDIETPGTDVDVDRNTDTGAVDVDVDSE